MILRVLENRKVMDSRCPMQLVVLSGSCRKWQLNRIEKESNGIVINIRAAITSEVRRKVVIMRQACIFHLVFL